ncbi:MAG: hypothetical protein J0H42_00345 [Rhizobiales bacterium]|nr:hypothetical protein [Hyphomicrobiales bacterium]
MQTTVKARGVVVGRALEYNFTTLRISRAYVSLLSRPEGEAAAISLAWIGDHEIRMHAAPPAGDAKQPLFIIDVFDHDARLLIDSRACHTVAEGAVAFDEFLHMAEPAAGGPHGTRPN